MCGIVGIYNHHLHTSDVTQTLKGMLARIHHRGPDETGIYAGKHVGLGNARLSIIDLHTGQQPISNEDQTLWIVFNGEIFNYIELRKELTKQGHVFKTTTDTEVVVHLYEEYGTNCLNKLNGQFVFAIWDKHKGELFIARDRVGIRPLFYTEHKGQFIFGSEIKTFLEFPDLDLQISPHGLMQVFTFWTTPSPGTIFQNIKELKPGHYMIVSGTKRTIAPYWELFFPEQGNENKIRLDEAVEQFHALFEDAVRIRLRADVPVGAYLSGGIDSSVTTAFIKRIHPDLLRTFSIGFSEKEFDESDYQKMAVDHLQTNHTEITCTPQEISNAFPRVIWHTEMPILRTAPVPMYLLSRNVHKHQFKVVITGEGADEMLAGYNIFKEMAIRRFWARQPDSRVRPLLLQKLYPYLPQMQNAQGHTLKFFFGYRLKDTRSPFYSHLLRWHNTSRLKNHFSASLKASINNYDPLSELEAFLPLSFENKDPLSQAQWLESTIFMSGYLLSSQGDRMAMAHSVEGRYPFLDYRVIEFCNTLPPQFKLNGLEEKYLLKKLMSGQLPDPIINRPKQAYRAPIYSTFISNTPEYLPDLLSGHELKDSGIFNAESVQRLINNMKHAKQISEVDNMALTGIISTQLLYDQFVRRKHNPISHIDYKNCKIIDDTI